MTPPLTVNLCLVCAAPLAPARREAALPVCSPECYQQALLAPCFDCGEQVWFIRCVRYDRDGERHQPRCAVPLPTAGTSWRQEDPWDGLRE